MRTVQTSISSLKLGREKHHVAIIGLRDQSYSFHGPEIRGLGKPYAYAMPGISAVSDEEIIVDLTYTRIFNSEFFVVSKNTVSRRHHKRFRGHFKIIAVFAPR